MRTAPAATLLQRRDLLLINVQFGLQISLFFLDLRQVCLRFARSRGLCIRCIRANCFYFFDV